MNDKELGRSLLEGCVLDPTPAPKLVYADWLEEDGRPDTAHAFRWCARLMRHPKMTPAGRVAGWERLRMGVVWHPQRVKPHLLPWRVFDCMRPSQATHYGETAVMSFTRAMYALSGTLRQMRRNYEGVIA
jgi:hypothetical protein